VVSGWRYHIISSLAKLSTLAEGTQSKGTTGKHNLDLNFERPCDLPMLRKLFQPAVNINWMILGEET
jgi:hypothetical protein